MRIYKLCKHFIYHPGSVRLTLLVVWEMNQSVIDGVCVSFFSPEYIQFPCSPQPSL